MNDYSVDIRFRPNYNRGEVLTRHLSVRAHSKDAALLMAGNKIGLEQLGIVPESIVVTVTRMRRAGRWTS